MANPRVALATIAELPDLDEDGPALLAALADEGVRGEPAAWDDRDVDWGAFDLVVVRSTWDYPDRHDEFMGWAEHVTGVSRLANPLPILRWNTDKRYLAELTAAGLPVVPTTWIEPGRPFELPDEEIVVKPTVSVGSRDTARYPVAEAARARAHVERLAGEGRVAMVQPYIHSVDATGETALLWLGGAFSHAIGKGPLLRPGAKPVEGLYAPETICARTASADELAVASSVLDAVPGGPDGLLYARVDLVAGPDGPLVLELELTEPSLFLGYEAGAAPRLAKGIARWL
jgi:glutathione synthase/RimK-type ligase-like ATP-grasp enzyme